MDQQGTCRKLEFSEEEIPSQANLTGELELETPLRRVQKWEIIGTGNFDSVDSLKAKEAGIRQFLKKPLFLKELSTAIRNAVDQIQPIGSKSEV